MIKMNEDKLILRKYSSGYFVSSVKENKEWNNIEQLYKISKEIYEDIERLQNNWNELKKWAEERIKNANKCLNDPNENWDEDANGYVLARKFQLEETLKEMQELEGK